MQPEKNLVEEALIQMKQIEDVLAENAKGILSSTMKEEIEELVKESLNEQEDIEDDETDLDIEDSDSDMDMEDDMEDEMDLEDEDEMDLEDEDEIDLEDEDEIDMDDDVIDMRGASQSELLKVFKAMDDEDGIIISKDGNDISLTDEDSDSEYLIKLGEQIEDFGSDIEDEEEFDMEDEEGFDMEDDEEFGMEDEEEFGMEDVDMELDEDDTQSTIDKIFEKANKHSDIIYEIEMEDEEEFDIEDDEEFDMEDEEEFDIEDDEDFDCSNFSTSDYLAKHPKATISDIYDYLKEKGCLSGGDGNIGENYNYLGEAKKTSKFKYKMPKNGFNEKMKEGRKKMGTGKAKFNYDKSAANVDGKMKKVTTGKKQETKEASRTYGMGSKAGRGLKKGITPNRNLNLEALENQVLELKQKNNDYKKSLNIFREKLNDVAVFNANLAYATRLFTEHSTTKKEKINILRRFDNIQTLQESKNLYATINNELSKDSNLSLNESVNRKISNVASTGSSANLIESKTYENPQFLRMKDLMGKLG